MLQFIWIHVDDTTLECDIQTRNTDRYIYKEKKKKP